MNTQQVFKRNFLQERIKSKFSSQEFNHETDNKELPDDIDYENEEMSENDNNLSLEQRIKLLENQSNHLLYFVFFMYENFPELVKKIIPVQKMFGVFMNSKPHVPQEEMPAKPRQASAKRKINVTPREYEILLLLAEGLCAKEIATKLYISESTVVTHKKNLKEKFEARNTAELISKAVKWTEENS